MDPVATLRMIDDFVKADQHGDEVDEWCDDLRAWIRGGGFEPNWGAFPLGTSYYHCRDAAVQREARAAVAKVREAFPTSQQTPDPAAVAAHSMDLYGALVCILSDLEALGHVGPMTQQQAERAVLAVHMGETPAPTKSTLAAWLDSKNG